MLVGEFWLKKNYRCLEKTIHCLVIGCSPGGENNARENDSRRPIFKLRSAIHGSQDSESGFFKASASVVPAKWGIIKVFRFGQFSGLKSSDREQLFGSNANRQRRLFITPVSWGES